MKKLRVLSLFSGIGSPEKALERLGIDYELINYCEIDKYASKSYSIIHNVSEELNLGDITKIDIDKLKDFDLITHGSPCQDFSMAGKGKGGDEGSETRSSLMWNTVEIIKIKRPKYVIWENVKGVLTKKHIHNFEKYINLLNELGYTSYYKVLNAKDYGIPQHRERIFVVSILGEHNQFEFPSKIKLEKRLRDLLEDKVEEKYYLKDTKDFFIKNSFNMEAKGNGFRFSPHVKKNANISCCVTTRAGSRMDDNFILDIDSNKEKFEFSVKNEEIDLNRLGGVFDTDKAKRQAGAVWDKDGLCPTLDTMQGGWRQPLVVEEIKIERVGMLEREGWYDIEKRVHSTNGLAPTVECKNRAKYIDDMRIRKLTPKECWRLMGFDDLDVDKCISAKLSNTQLYKQAGNSIVVNVMEEIFKNLLKEHK